MIQCENDPLSGAQSKRHRKHPASRNTVLRLSIQGVEFYHQQDGLRMRRALQWGDKNSTELTFGAQPVGPWAMRTAVLSRTSDSGCSKLTQVSDLPCYPCDNFSQNRKQDTPSYQLLLLLISWGGGEGQSTKRLDNKGKVVKVDCRTRTQTQRSAHLELGTVLSHSFSITSLLKTGLLLSLSVARPFLSFPLSSFPSLSFQGPDTHSQSLSPLPHFPSPVPPPCFSSFTILPSILSTWLCW